MYRGFSPARQREAEHYLSLADWPWRLLPAFLAPQVMALSQDTLPLILHQAEQGRLAMSVFQYFSILVFQYFSILVLGQKNPTSSCHLI